MGWRYNDLTAATGAPLAVFAPMGYMFDAQDTQHVVYHGYVEDQGPDGHIHELWWDSDGWHHNDLTAATGAPLAFEAPWGYVFAAQGTQHVLYLGLGANGQGTDGHIHELYWDGQWHHNDLTAATGAPSTATTPIGYAFETQRTQHVFYLSGGDIHELWWDTNGWHHNDVTAASGAPNSLDNLAAHLFFAQGTQHIFYVRGLSGGTDDHIHELWWDSNGWHDHDLTIAASAPLYGLGYLRSYVFAAQGTQHVLYLAVGNVGQGGDGHVHELYWDGQWHHNDLTAATGAPLASQPTGYVFDAQGTQHVVYQGLGADPYNGDGHIHELYWDGQWHHNDLTVATGAPLAWGANQPLGGYDYPTGYGFVAQGTQHVVYRAIDSHIIELYWSPD